MVVEEVVGVIVIIIVVVVVLDGCSISGCGSSKNGSVNRWL